MPVHEITSQEMFDEVLKEHPAVVVNFYGNRCPPCTFIAPLIEKYSNDEKFKDVYFVKANVHELLDLREAAEVSCIPTISVYKNGVQVVSEIGEDVMGVSDTGGLILRPQGLANLLEQAV